MGMTDAAMPSMEVLATSIALPSMALPTTAIPSMALPTTVIPSTALPSMAGSQDHQTWASIHEAGRRADSAEDLASVLRLEIYRLQLENNMLAENLRMSNTNFNQATFDLESSIRNNRNIQTAVSENIILKKKVALLEARLAELESNIHNQEHSEHFSLEEMSEEAIYSGSNRTTRGQPTAKLG